MTSRKMKVLVFLFPFITFICCYEPIEVKVDLTMPVFTAEIMKQYNGAEVCYDMSNDNLLVVLLE